MIFRSPRWFIPPILVCLATVLTMAGAMGRARWMTTVVTSNFTSLLLILTLAMSVHVIARFREIQAEHPNARYDVLAWATIRELIQPCFFMVMTTIVGFASLILSGIRPVMDFGWMMTFGLLLSFLFCFTLLPALLMLTRPRPSRDLAREKEAPSGLAPLANFTARHPLWIAVIAVLILVVCGVGMTRLTVEARFIDYFRKTTPIHESITLLDDEMGGAMPLEVVIEGNGKDFFMEPSNLETLSRIHNYIDDLPETAKVISGATMRAIIQAVNKGNPVTKPILSMARNALPPQYYRYIVAPYMTPDFDQARIMIRVRDSDRELQRTSLRNKIESFLNDEMKLKTGEKSHVTGYFVLYDNMLQSLVRSQIATVGTVFITVGIMFALLFRSILLAAIGLAPNALAVAVVLGVMGWLGIHLDMMTVMIAAITFGMADDNTIHYIHRFRSEFPKDGDYVATMRRCHDTIGRSLSYTMMATVAGFAILGFSSFIPTAYFGLFTSLAMFAALIACHTVLPMLIIAFKPFGKGKLP